MCVLILVTVTNRLHARGQDGVTRHGKVTKPGHASQRVRLVWPSSTNINHVNPPHPPPPSSFASSPRFLYPSLSLSDKLQRRRHRRSRNDDYINKSHTKIGYHFGADAWCERAFTMIVSWSLRVCLYVLRGVA